jgi:hypothetical protein
LNIAQLDSEINTFFAEGCPLIRLCCCVSPLHKAQLTILEIMGKEAIWFGVFRTSGLSRIRQVAIAGKRNLQRIPFS